MVSDGLDGFLVPQEDANSIAKAIELCVNDDARLRMGVNALRRAQNQFDFRETSKKLLAAIEVNQGEVR